MNRKANKYTYGKCQHKTPKGLHSEHSHFATNLRKDVERCTLSGHHGGIFFCVEKNSGMPSVLLIFRSNCFLVNASELKVLEEWELAA